jgi:hypothetical protein
MLEDRGERAIKKIFPGGIPGDIQIDDVEIEKNNSQSSEEDCETEDLDDSSLTASALKIFGGITIAVATVCGIVLWVIMAGNSEGGLGFIYFLACVLGGVLSGLLLIGFSEVISTLRRIERNTNRDS